MYFLFLFIRFGKRPSLLKKYTDLKKPKVETMGLSAVSPLNPVVTTAGQDMFVNDGSFLERFKKLQGLVRKCCMLFILVSNQNIEANNFLDRQISKVMVMVESYKFANC